MNFLDAFNKLLDPKLEPKDTPAVQPMADEQLRKAVKKAFAELRLKIEKQQEEINELRKKVKELNNLNHEIERLSNTISLLAKYSSQPPATATKPVSVPLASAPASTQNTMNSAPKPVFPQVLYAKTVDCFRPVGFVAENLRTSDEGCVFKIVLFDNDNGTFELVDNFDMRQVMLAAFAPLVTDTSEYSDLPLDPNDINTIDKGTLRREGAVLAIAKKQTVKII